MAAKGHELEVFETALRWACEGMSFSAIVKRFRAEGVRPGGPPYVIARKTLHRRLGKISTIRRGDFSEVDVAGFDAVAFQETGRFTFEPTADEPPTESEAPSSDATPAAPARAQLKGAFRSLELDAPDGAPTIPVPEPRDTPPPESVRRPTRKGQTPEEAARPEVDSPAWCEAPQFYPAGDLVAHLIPNEDLKDDHGYTIIGLGELRAVCSVIYRAGISPAEAALAVNINAVKFLRALDEGVSRLKYGNVNPSGYEQLARAVYGHVAQFIVRIKTALVVKAGRGDVKAMQLAIERHEAMLPDFSKDARKVEGPLREVLAKVNEARNEHTYRAPF